MPTNEKIIEPPTGFVYLSRCPSHKKDLYKIGSTSRSTTQRMRELSSSTASPEPFKTHYEIRVFNPKEVEKMLHEYFRAKRQNHSREFFTISLDEGIEAFKLFEKRYRVPDRKKKKRKKVANSRERKREFVPSHRPERSLKEEVEALCFGYGEEIWNEFVEANSNWEQITHKEQVLRDFIALKQGRQGDRKQDTRNKKTRTSWISRLFS